MNSKSNKRVGAGMKSRGKRARAVKPGNKEGATVSTGAVQQQGSVEPQNGQDHGNQTGGSLGTVMIQNLESAAANGKNSDDVIVAPVLGGDVTDAPPILGDLAALMDSSIEPTLDNPPEPPAEVERNPVDDAANVHHLDLGEQPDGTFAIVVIIPEGMIEPVRQQAESDKVTPEEWLTTRMTEYLESWWGPAASR